MRIVVFEIHDSDSDIFDKIMEIVESHPDIECLRVKDESMLSLPGLEIYPGRRKIYRDRREINLTTKEYDLLCLLAANRGQVLTYDQIYRKVWGEDAYGDESNAIGCHIRHLREKLYEAEPDAPFTIRCVREVLVGALYIEADECYDFIFLTVREDQLRTALQELQDNISPTIVTMVNSLETYDKWEGICGKGKILPAFPGAGGSFKNDILDAALTPRIVQPTTFAEIGGERSERLLSLAKIFKRSRIPYQIVADMHTWQLCHLAMVVPLADAYYDAVNPRKVGYEWKVMEKTAKRMKRNCKALRRTGHVLSPKKMYLFCCMPVLFLTVGLKITFLSSFGDKFMYRHAMKAPDEMRELHRQFYGYIKRRLGE